MDLLITAIACLVVGWVAGWFYGRTNGMQDADYARKKEHHEHQD